MTFQRTIRFAVWCGIASFLTSALYAERLPVKTYTVADGLLRDAVSRIRQDSRGFLWFCTVEGMSRFDGYAFVNFRVEDGLPDRHVNDFIETSRGDYLIATERGLARLNPRGDAGSTDNPLFTTYLPEDPKAHTINVLFEDRDGTIWVGAGSGGLFRFIEADGEFKLEKYPGAEIPAVSIMQDRRSALWIGAEHGNIVRLFPKEGRVERYTTADGLPNSVITSLLEDADGRIWAGLRPSEPVGLLRMVAEPAPGKAIVERAFSTKEGLPANWIPAIFQASDGKFWIATTSGLCLWQGENQGSVCRTYTEKNDVCDTEITSLTEDRDGNLWVGTNRCGVKKMARHGFTAYNEADNLGSAIVVSIFENTAGEIFFSARRKGTQALGNAQMSISRFSADNRFTTVQPKFPREISNLGWGWKQLARQDLTGAWWLPTGEGLFRSRPGTDIEDLDQARLEEIKTGAKDKEIFRLFEDSRGNIWIAIGTELWFWERASDAWRDYTYEAGFSKFTVGTVFVEDRSGSLWIATGSDGGDGRLIRYRDGSFHTFTEAEGAPLGWTRDMYVDDTGRLWLANTANGLLRLDRVDSEKLEFVRYGLAQGFSSNAVYCVTGDEFGRIYAGTGRGLDRLTPESGEVENFTTADGLPGSYVELAYRDRKNQLWFGTHDGLVRFTPAPPRARRPPTVLITGLRIAGSKQPISILGEKQISQIDLGPAQNQVSLDFIGLGVTLGEKLSYEFRVLGADWEPTLERTVNFANLAAGTYSFEVRASTVDHIYSEPAVFSFRIAAPIWQRWWFVLIACVFVAGVVYLIYRGRVQRLLEMERIRTRIATDLHDDIGANLTRISILSEVAKQKAENGNGGLLSSIADIARESVASMNDIVWAVAPEHDSLLDLTRRMRRHAEEVFASRDIELAFEAPESDASLKLGVGTRRDLLLVFKEAVNNAARHSGCSKVEISLTADNSELVLEISDNGRGFDVNDAESGGQGLRSMARRASTIGCKFTLDSQRDGGTRVTLLLPLDKAEQN